MGMGVASEKHVVCPERRKLRQKILKSVEAKRKEWKEAKYNYISLKVVTNGYVVDSLVERFGKSEARVFERLDSAIEYIRSNLAAPRSGADQAGQ